MKNNSLGTKVLMAALTLALVAYFGIQAVRYFSDPLTTTLAYNYRVEESEHLSGFVVREEVLLPEENSGLLQIRREEGERVSSGGTVAAVYTDQAALNRQTEIEALELQIEQIQYAKEAAKGEDVVQKLDVQIRRNLRDYRAAVAAERFRDVEKQASSLRSQVLKRDYSGANAGELDERISELQGQVKALQAQGAGAARRITTQESGLGFHAAHFQSQVHYLSLIESWFLHHTHHSKYASSRLLVLQKASCLQPTLKRLQIIYFSSLYYILYKTAQNYYFFCTYAKKIAESCLSTRFLVYL